MHVFGTEQRHGIAEKRFTAWPLISVFRTGTARGHHVHAIDVNFCAINRLVLGRQLHQGNGNLPADRIGTVATQALAEVIVNGLLINDARPG